MNPATDAGKRELPAPLRNRFTEIWVPEPSQRWVFQHSICHALCWLCKRLSLILKPECAHHIKSLSTIKHISLYAQGGPACPGA